MFDGRYNFQSHGWRVYFWVIILMRKVHTRHSASRKLASAPRKVERKQEKSISSYRSTSTMFGVANIHGSNVAFVMIQIFAPEKVETEQ